MQDAIAVQSLKTDIALLRQHIFPPPIFGACRGANLLWFARRSLGLLPTMERFNRKGHKSFFNLLWKMNYQMQFIYQAI